MKHQPSPTCYGKSSCYFNGIKNFNLVISSFIFTNYFGTRISKTFLCHSEKVMAHLACRGIITSNAFVIQIMILDSMFPPAKAKSHEQAPECQSSEIVIPLERSTLLPKNYKYVSQASSNILFFLILLVEGVYFKVTVSKEHCIKDH